MALRHLVAAVAALCLVSVAAASVICESSSVMFGSPWRPDNPYYIQESAWKTHGNITKINVYFDGRSGCLVGIKPTYGWQATNARRLGIEKIGDKQVPSKDIKLQKGEFINKAKYKFGSCITYLALQTNMGRQLSVGSLEAPGPLQTSQPDVPNGFLAYFKAYTDEPNTRANSGKLEQLQMIWASKNCGGSSKLPISGKPVHSGRRSDKETKMVQRVAAPTPSDVDVVVEEVPPEAVGGGEKKQLPPAAEPTPSGPVEAVEAVGTTGTVTPGQSTAAAVSQQQPTIAPGATVTTKTTTVLLTNETQYTTTVPDVGACKGGLACSKGMCATSSCALNGMGKDVATMMCFGTNIVPNPILDLTTGNPCTNLACKLDRPNCTSPVYRAGFCTGKVVAMGTVAKLHPSGKAFLGYPCIEHRGPVVDLVPVGDYSAKGTYAAKAWKVCDCISGPGLKDGSIAFRTKDGGSITIIPPKFPTLPHFPFVNRTLIQMSLPDVLAQWVAANLLDASVPKVSLNSDAVKSIKSILPNFTMPSLVIPKVSAPLMNLPKNFSLPVFVLPVGNRTLHKVSTILPDITSLPTLVVPSLDVQLPMPKIQLPQITITNLDDWANNFGVPTMPKLSLIDATFIDAVRQWAAANEFSLPVPKLQLPENKLNPLRALLPNFTVPSLLVLNISAPLMELPHSFNIPVVTIPDAADIRKQVAALVPRLTSLPAFVVPPIMPKGAPKLPQLTLPNITVPDFEDIVAKISASLPKLPRLPEVPSSFNISLPDLPGNFSLNLPTIHGLNFTLPASAPGMNLPDLQPPNLKSIVTAISNLPDLKIDWTQWPNVISEWSKRYLTRPEFDMPGFLNMVQQNDVTLPDGFEISFEVPTVMAQWVSGIVQRSQLPNITADSKILQKLRAIIPDLPTDKPSMMVVNISSPYFDQDAPAANKVPTFMVPDELVPKITSILPNLTYVPTLLVPKLPDLEITLSLPDIRLPDVTKPSFLQGVGSMMTRVHDLGPDAATAGSAVLGDMEAMLHASEAPAASDVPAAAPAETTTVTTVETTEATSNTEPAAAAVPVATSEPAPAAPTAVPKPATAAPKPATAAPKPATAATAAAAPLQAPAEQEEADVVVTEVKEAETTAAQPASQGATGSQVPKPDAAHAAKPNKDSGSGTSGAKPPKNNKAEVKASADAGKPAKPATAAAAAVPAPAAAAGGITADNGVTVTEVKLQEVTAAPEEESPKGHMENGYLMDEEGAIIMSGSADTAFMDPEEFYALDKETQEAFKAIFKS